MSAIDIFDIKVQNVKRIISAVRFEKSMTKKEISDATALSFATVSNLCNELVDKGILSSAKKGGMSVGRTPSGLTFSSEKFNTICINLQMQGVMNFAVLTLSNAVVFQKKYDISAMADARQIIQFAKHVLDEELPAEAHQGHVFVGVGVAVSSIFDIEKGILIDSAIDLFAHVPMKQIVEEVFGLPTYVDNEANLCALSVSGTEGKNANIVYLYLSQGVGVGITCEGHLLRGARGYAGEIGHMPIGAPDLRCPTCGNYGCIENDLSAGGFLNHLYGPQRDAQSQNWDSFIAGLKAGDEKAMRLCWHNGLLLGKLASVLVNLFDPSMLYVGGEIAQIFDYLREPFRKELDARSLVAKAGRLDVLCDTNSDDTINVGISEQICQKWSETVLQEQYD